MKKINFIVILLTFVVSMVTFFYIDVLSELIVRTESSFIKVTKLDILGIFLATLVWAMIPSWAIAYAYRKIQTNKWWIAFIGVIYTIVWIGISFLLMNDYITYFGNTWLSSEIFHFTVGKEHFLLAYFLSFIPLIMLGIFNVRRIDEVR